MAAEFETQVLAGGTMGERDVVVSNIIEEVDLFFLEEQGGRDRVNRSITPSFVEETPFFVQEIKEVDVSFRSKPVQIAHFKVGPLQTG